MRSNQDDVSCFGWVGRNIIPWCVFFFVFVIFGVYEPYSFEGGTFGTLESDAFLSLF